MRVGHLVLATAALAAATPSAAATIIDASPDAIGPILYSPINTGISALAWSFTLIADTRLTGLAIYGPSQDFYGNPKSSLGDAVRVEFYDDVGMPGTLLTSFVDSLDAIDGAGTSSDPTLSRKFTQFDAAFTLAAGTYWVRMSGVSHDPGLSLYLSSPGSTADELSGFFQSAGPFDAAYRLYGDPVATPEPGMIGLLGFGLAGVAVARRRRRGA